MAMSRKDYELIAHAIFATAKAIPDGETEAARAGAISRRMAIEAVAKRIADELAVDNQRFDRKRFVAACGFPS